MAAVPLLGVAFTVLWWVVGYTSKVDQNQNKLDALAQEMRDNFKQLKDDQIKELQTQIAIIPELKARLQTEERTIQQLQSTNLQLQDRINSASSMAGQAVEVMKQLYQPDIPVRRTK